MRPLRSRSTTSASGCGAGAAGAHVRAPASRGERPLIAATLKVLSGRHRQTRRRAGESTRTGYTGDLGYELWLPWDRASRMGRAYDRPGHAPRRAGMLALTSPGSKPPAAHRRGLPQQPQGQHRRADVHPGRTRARAAGGARQGGAVRRPRGAAARARRRASAPDRRPRGALEGRRGDLRADRTAAHRAGRGVAAGGARLSRSPAGGEGDDHRLVADAEATDRPGHHRSSALRQGTELQFEITVEATRYTAVATVVPTPFLNLARRTAPV